MLYTIHLDKENSIHKNFLSLKPDVHRKLHNVIAEKHIRMINKRLSSTYVYYIKYKIL